MKTEQIEHSGFWWDPAKPNERWAGTLHINRKGRSTLTLTVEPASFAAWFHLREFDVLHGETTSGRPMSVLKCFEQKHGRFFVNATIIGLHAETADPTIARSAVVIRNVNIWWGPSAIENVDIEKWPDEATVRYTKPQPVVVFDDGVFTITISSGAGVTSKEMAHTVVEEIRIEIAAISPRPFSEFSKRIYACRDLFSVACLSLCNVQELRLYPVLDDSARRRFQAATYHASPIFRERKSDRPTSWHDLLFRREDVSSERLKDVFTTWLGQADRFHVVRSLYHAGSYGKGFLEFRFLSLAQAAEAYHNRAFPKRTYLSKADYKARVLDPVQSVLPKDLDDRLRESIESALAFGNQIKFRERLEDLFAEHSAALATVVPTPSDWINKIKNYRNAFTHHPTNRDTTPFDHEDVLRCLFMLKMLLEMAFLRSMGFTPEEITGFAKRNHRYSQIKERFFTDRQMKQAVDTTA